MSPLEAINWSEIPLFSILKAEVIQELSRGVTVPYPNFLVTKELGICLTFDEPSELFGETPPKYILCGKNWEALRQVKPHLVSKLSEDACTGTVLLVFASADNILNNLQVLHFWMNWVLGDEL